MGLFQKLFKNRNREITASKSKKRSNDFVNEAALDIKTKVDNASFLSKKEYLDILGAYQSLFNEIKTMEDIRAYSD